MSVIFVLDFLCGTLLCYTLVAWVTKRFISVGRVALRFYSGGEGRPLEGMEETRNPSTD
ncbi:MAG TPA: hypothetical protein VMX16_03405 [Terriglobia bacterium]|nr:hypothetical protein [Terriglobia bacterium]